MPGLEPRSHDSVGAKSRAQLIRCKKKKKKSHLVMDYNKAGGSVPASARRRNDGGIEKYGWQWVRWKSSERCLDWWTLQKGSPDMPVGEDNGVTCEKGDERVVVGVGINEVDHRGLYSPSTRRKGRWRCRKVRMAVDSMDT
jgi:hypothetical protein